LFKQAVYNIAYYLSRDKLVLGLIILFFMQRSLKKETAIF